MNIVSSNYYIHALVKLFAFDANNLSYPVKKRQKMELALFFI